MYSRHLSAEYRPIFSAHMVTDSRPIYQPILGRYVGRESSNISTDINRHACRPTPGRYFNATRPPLGRYLTDTRPTLRSFAQLSLLSSIFSTQLRGAFSGRRPFLAFNSGSIHVFFPAMFFPRHLFLYTTLVTYGSSSFWGLLLTEVRYFRVAKNDIKS